MECERPGFSPWVGKISWEREHSTHSSILAWRILYSPWGCKKSDMTERLSLSLFSSMVASKLSGFLHVSSEYSGDRGIVREGEGSGESEGAREQIHTKWILHCVFNLVSEILHHHRFFLLEASQ